MSVSTTIQITCDDCGTFGVHPGDQSLKVILATLASRGWMSSVQSTGRQDYCPRCVRRRMDTSRPTVPAARSASALKGWATKRGGAA